MNYYDKRILERKRPTIASGRGMLLSEAADFFV